MRYSQIKKALREAEIIDEVSMSPSALQKFANSPEAEGMLMGIEFEMCVPNVGIEDDSGDGEYDYDMDERANDIDDIIRFFREGEMSNLSASGADRLRNEMWDQYLDWQSGQIMENLDTDELNDRIRERLDGEIDFDDMTEMARERWIEENPEKNPEDKESEDEIHQMALEFNEKTLDDMMEDTNGRDYQSAYDDIRQEMEDEMRDDSDYDQEAWLRDIGVDYMSEAEREWSLDWPHWTSYGGDGELDVDTVGDEFGRAMGLDYVNTSNNYHGARRDGKNWIIEPDSSIDADEGDGGLEFVSPPMPIKDGLAMLEKMYAWAKKEGCYTNKSTGLHMNISVPNMSIENLDYVKLALFLGDEHVLREFDRQYNNYAKSAMSIVKEKIQQNPENATALLAKMKEHLNAAASKLVHTGITNKYTSINTKSNYVEFRGPGGDYLNQDLSKLTSTALRLAQSLRIATDENAYKQEYAKKLYKLVGPKEGEWTDPNNSVALFSRYALGQINKEELVSNVRQAQIARKEKKGDEVQYWVMNKDGSGGKQMVFAAGETAAIILGGKQMGMTREESIRKLRAELFVDPDAVPDSVPRGWKEWVNDILPTVNLETVNAVRQRIINGLPFTGGDNLDAAAGAWVVKQIDVDLRRRMNTPPAITDMPESMPGVWRHYLREIAPRATASDLRDSIRFIDNGDRDDQLDTDNKAFARNYLETLVRWKEQGDAGSGVVDNNETRWKVTANPDLGIAYRNAQPVYVDADSPRQAKVKAVEIFRREAGLNISPSDMEAIATTQDAGRDAAVELPTSWALFVHNITNYSDEVLANTRQELLAGHMDDQLDMAQGSELLNKIDAEQQRRSSSAASTPSSPTATYASSEMYRTLPEGWRQILDNIAILSSENLQRYIDGATNAHYDILSAEQKDFIVNSLNAQLRSRRETDYTAMANAAHNAENAVRASLPQSHREFLDDLANKSDIGLINILRNNNVYQGVSEQAAAYFRVQLKHELRRRGINPDSEAEANSTNTQAAVDQQAELINRDDPVTSNDPEARSPIAQTTATDFEIVNSSGEVQSRISGGDMVYAHRKARELEQDLGLDSGELSVRALPTQTNESIKELRRLAGLK